MKRTLKIAPALLGAAAALALWPSGAGAATSGGVVVGKLRGAVLVASPAGLVRAVAGHASIGSRVAFSGGKLVVVGHSRTAHIRGIVVRRVGAVTFISSNRHVVAVHGGRRAAAFTGDTPPAPSTPTAPAPGDTVSTQVSIASGGELDEQSEDDLGASGASTLQIQAVVKAVGAGTVTITVNGQDLTINLPAGLTLPASVVGQTVTLSVDLNGNGNGDDDSGDNSGNNSGGSSAGGGGSGDGGGD